MARPFSELKGKMTTASLKRAQGKAKAMMREMALQELRRARLLSQEQLAKTLNLGQPSVSKLEQRTDMYISTLRGFITAMGGDLQIIARFPDGDVKIVQFEDLDALALTSQAGEKRGRYGKE